MLTCLEEIVAHTHNLCICLILVCCVSYLCALMLINISSCMLVWLHFCIGRSQKGCTKSPLRALYRPDRFNSVAVRALYGRCTCAVQSAVQGALHRAPLCFLVRTEQGRCTGALRTAPYVQRPRQIWGQLIKTTTLWFGPLYICHFDFRSMTRVHIQIS